MPRNGGNEPDDVHSDVAEFRDDFDGTGDVDELINQLSNDWNVKGHKDNHSGKYIDKVQKFDRPVEPNVDSALLQVDALPSVPIEVE